jgi:intracellular multiplication protein IcmE
MQEERIQQQQIVNQQPTVPPPEAPPVDTKTPAVNAMAKAMSMQMESVLANQQIKAPHFQHITSMDYLEAIQAKEQQAREDALAKQQAMLGGAAADGKIQNIIIPAGTIEYAQLITEANTDAPGPVMAQIASGPLAGSRLIGTFAATDEYLTLNFNTVVIDGVSEAANAVAIDPQTTLPGMVTEIDRRYLKRIILPAAAAFVEGLGEAIADSGQTTIYVEGDNAVESSGNKDNREEVATGFKEAGEKMSDLLEEEADATRPMLRIAAGTPIGVMFITPVIEGDDLEEQNQRGKRPPDPATAVPEPATALYPVIPDFAGGRNHGDRHNNRNNRPGYERAVSASVLMQPWNSDKRGAGLDRAAQMVPAVAVKTDAIEIV